MFDYRDFIEELREFVEQDDRHGWNGHNVDYDGFRNTYGEEVLDFYGVDYQNSEQSIEELLDSIKVPSGIMNEFADPEFSEEFKMYSK